MKAFLLQTQPVFLLRLQVFTQGHASLTPTPFYVYENKVRPSSIQSS